MSEYTGQGASLRLMPPPGVQTGPEEFGPPKYGTWQQAFMGHELGSYAWQNRPGMNQLVPGYDPDESTVQKLADFGSLPARLAAAPLLMGGEAWRRWMSGDQGPETRQMMLEALLGIGVRGLALESPGPASFGAWHGSPHLFQPEPDAPLGAFKPIEEVAYTGEGSQAFAYGHYVAGKRQTSESYMQPGSLNITPGVHTLDGKQVDPLDYLDTNTPAYMGLNHLGYNGGDHAAALKDLHNEARLLYKEAQKFPVGDPTRMDILSGAKEYLDGAKWLTENKDRVSYTPPPPVNPGHLYQVAVRPDEHELLDWDRPLSQQSPEVQQKITEGFGPGWLKDRGDWTGNKFYQHMGKNTGTPEEASKELHDAGIPGVRFQDAGSRGLPAGHPDETHNYVIFHHSNLRVIDRDGKHYGLEPVEGDPWQAQAAATP